MKNKIAFENLRVEMARKSLTISDVADKIGVSRSTISKKFDTQSEFINLKEASRISKLLGCTVEYLFSEVFERA